MFKQPLVTLASVVILAAGPGHLTLTAAAQTMGRGYVSRVPVTPMIATGLDNPVLGASPLAPGLMPVAALSVPSLPVAPILAVSAAVWPQALAATPVLPAASKGSPLDVIGSQGASAAEKHAALNRAFDNSGASSNIDMERVSVWTNNQAMKVLLDEAFVKTGIAELMKSGLRQGLPVKKSELTMVTSKVEGIREDLNLPSTHNIGQKHDFLYTVTDKSGQEWQGRLAVYVIWQNTVPLSINRKHSKATSPVVWYKVG